MKQMYTVILQLDKAEEKMLSRGLKYSFSFLHAYNLIIFYMFLIRLVDIFFCMLYYRLTVWSSPSDMPLAGVGRVCLFNNKN
jgi:hypothetical protein